MFTDKELETIIDVSKRKKIDILNSRKDSDFEYLRNLQTLVTLEDSVQQLLDKMKS